MNAIEPNIIQRNISRLAFAFAVVLLACALTNAQTIQRTFVSTSGLDSNTANNCSRQQPCRGFAAAISVVSAGGEVIALDSGGYGAVAINKSVSIISAPGVYAGITVFSGNGININASGATVVLKGLTINRQGAGNVGIFAQSFAALYIEDCIVNGFSSIGIYVSTQTDAQVFIENTTVRNGNDSGVFFESTGIVRASIDRSRAEKNAGSGFTAGLGSRVTVSNSIANGNGASGFYAINVGGTVTTAEMSADGCVASGNQFGFRLNGPPTNSGQTRPLMCVARSIVTNNTFGYSNNGGTFLVLAGTNMVDQNGTNRSGVFSVLGTDTNP